MVLPGSRNLAEELEKSPEAVERVECKPSFGLVASDAKCSYSSSRFCILSKSEDQEMRTKLCSHGERNSRRGTETPAKLSLLGKFETRFLPPAR